MWSSVRGGRHLGPRRFLWTPARLRSHEASAQGGLAPGVLGTHLQLSYREAHTRDQVLAPPLASEPELFWCLENQQPRGGSAAGGRENLPFRGQGGWLSVSLLRGPGALSQPQNSAPSAEETWFVSRFHLLWRVEGWSTALEEEGGAGAQLPRRRDGEATAGPPRGPRGWG